MAGNLYHLVQKEVWDACKASPSNPYFPSTYQQDGFIHLTQDPLLLLPVANHFYQDVPGAFLVLQLNAQKLTAPIRFEAAAPVGDKATADWGEKAAEPVLFPHLYGAIDLEAVHSELAVTRDDSGVFTSIEGLEAPDR